MSYIASAFHSQLVDRRAHLEAADGLVVNPTQTAALVIAAACLDAADAKASLSLAHVKASFAAWRAQISVPVGDVEARLVAQALHELGYEFHWG